MAENQFDVIIIGAGPAGLTAGLYASRRALKTLIISKDLGGQVSLTTEIENYPGVDFIDGITLMRNFLKQTEKFGAKLTHNEVNKIEKTAEGFQVATDGKKYQAKAIILAFGLTPKNLEVPGEEKLRNKGISYCTTCDGPLFKNKKVVVVGGGNSALDAAELLSKIANQVFLIHRRDQFRGDEILVQRIKKAKNVKLLLNSQVKEIKGEDKVEEVIVKQKTGQTRELKVDGVFIEVGYQAKTDWLSNLVELNKNGEVIVDKNFATSTPGIFAAGDVTDFPYKQIVISAGQGAAAALQAYQYIAKKEGKKTIPDWGKK